MKLSNQTKLIRRIALVSMLCSAALTARADFASNVLSMDPIIYYRLNETVQPPAADIATNSGSAGALGNAYYYNSTTVDTTGNPTHGVPGALAGDSDTAVTFDGSDQFVMMALPDEINTLNPTNEFTAELWVNPANNGTFECPVSFADLGGYGGNRDGWIIYDQGTAWNLRMYAGQGAGAAVNVSGGNPSPGTWDLLTVTYDGTNYNFYIDGQSVSSGPAAGFVPNRNGQLVFGCRSDEGYNFAGGVDEFALYTNVLSGAVVLSHYQNGTNASRATPYATLIRASSPMIYYRFDEAAYTAPLSLPAANNLGTLGTAANGSYIPGTEPGAAGPPFSGLGTNALACHFNGASGYVAFGDIVSLLGGIPPSLTVVSWVKINELEQNRGYDMIVGQGDDSFRIQRGGTGDHGTLQWAGTGLTPGGYEGVIMLDDGQWHFLVSIVTSTGMTNYVDGVLDASQVQTSGALATGSQLVSVGESIQYPGRVWNGEISEVALFATNLTPAQVQQLYSAANVSPEITQAPTVTPPVYEGSTVTLSVGAVGVPPLHFQWSRNGSALGGQTGTNLTLANVTVAGDNGTYAVVVTNVYGAVTSSVILSVVAGPPIIFQQPASLNLAVGGTATFTVVAGGTAPITYQWSQGATPIAGATSSTLVISPILSSSSGTYTVLLQNPHGSSNSAPATLTLLTPPNAYAAALMSLNPYTYWPLSSLSGGVTPDIAGGFDGSIQGTMTIGTGASGTGFGGTHNAFQFDGTSAYVDCGTAVDLDQSAQTIMAWILEPTASTHLAIITKSDNAWRLASYGDQVEFTETGTGPGNSGNEYFLTTGVVDDGAWHMIVGALDNGDKSFYLDGVLTENADVYGVCASNGFPVYIGENSQATGRYWNGLMSDIALFNRGLSAAEVSNLWQVAMTGASAPVIGVQPLSQTLSVGQQAVLSVILSAGSAPVTYQWYKGGAPIAGATAQTLAIPSAGYADSGNYDVVVSNAVSPAATSQTATLTVLPPDAYPNLTNGLVLHLTFDTNYNDSSGHNNNASAGGSPAFIAGKIGSGAIHVNTVASNSLFNFVSVPHSADFNFGPAPGTDFSVAFWVRYTGLPNDLPMIGNARNSTFQHGWVMTDDTGKPEWFLYATDDAGARSADPVAGSPMTDDGNWHNIVLTVAFAGNITTYVDGMEVYASATGALDDLDTGDGIFLGQDPSGTYAVSGAYDLDDVGIWNRALARTEAQSIYTAGQSGRSFNAVGPVQIAITASAGGPLLLWPSGTLQSAPSLKGPWNAVNGAAAPSYLVTPSGGQMFYRVKM